MARGKNTCRILKEIRRQIAEANDIDFVVEECKYKGDCLGTCPKCEAEVRYLESQLHQRQMLGKAVVVAGLSLSTLTANAQAQANVIPDDTIKVEQSKVVLNGKYKVSGTVFGSDDSDPLVGAYIRFKDDSSTEINKAIADMSGYFTIATDELPQTLIVRFVGYKEAEIKVKEKNYQTPLNIVLEPAEAMIGEVEYTRKSWIPKFLRKKHKNK